MVQACSKIGYDKCPLTHFKCMQKIEIDAIVESSKEFLKKNKTLITRMNILLVLIRVIKDLTQRNFYIPCTTFAGRRNDFCRTAEIFSTVINICYA